MNIVSPKTTINVVHDEIADQVSTLGISHIVAVTEKGEFNKPDTIINSVSQFREIYGRELVPDGSKSNIETALEIGSRLRISRVENNIIDEPRVYQTDNDLTNSGPNDDTILTALDEDFLTLRTNLFLKDNGDWGTIDIKFKLAPEFNPDYRFTLRIRLEFLGNLVQVIHLDLFDSIKRYDISNRSYPWVQTVPFIQYQNSHNNGYFFYQYPSILEEFSKGYQLGGQVKNLINAEIVRSDNPDIQNLTQLNTFLRSRDSTGSGANGILAWRSGNDELQDRAGSLYQISDNSVIIGEPTYEQWCLGLDSFRNYDDAYQLACSHIHQNLSFDDLITVYEFAKDLVQTSKNSVFYIDIPKTNDQGNPRSYTEIISYKDQVSNMIGYSEYISYFAGGWVYPLSPESNHINTQCDNLGTVIGIGDRSAYNYKPYKPFDGSRRGISYNATGIVSLNYGSSGMEDILDMLAKSQINISVIKTTRDLPSQKMLWNNFTSFQNSLDNPNHNPLIFLSVVRLYLYMKKELNIILQPFLEEPNIFSTWLAMYQMVLPFLGDLMDNQAIESYNWEGDQNVTNFSQLQINTEAEVRQGNYRARLTFVDVPTMSEITLDINILHNSIITIE